ncbi:hypothetical protein DDY07_23805 [Methylomonas sp. ZR1]|nr:hypothetical protein [Methylomonas sp. ZR1]
MTQNEFWRDKIFGGSGLQPHVGRRFQFTRQQVYRLRFISVLFFMCFSRITILPAVVATTKLNPFELR